jgi:UDP-glucose 4-epimerase
LEKGRETLKIEGSRVLVTGGTGLIGSHIIDKLIAEHPKEIIALDKNVKGFRDNCLPELDYKNVTLLEGDITRTDDVRKAVHGVDFVVHTASLLARDAAQSLRAAFDVNIGGTFNLLEASAEAGVKKIIYSSSVLVYGNNPASRPIAEDHCIDTDTIYGAGKVGSEYLLRVFKREKGLNYVTLRYCGVYGPRQHFRGNLVLYIPECFQRIDHGQPPIIYGDGSQPYDFVYVEDIARANVLALKSSVTGEVINIGTGMATTVGDVVQMIIEITGTSLDPEYAPQGERFQQKSLWPDVTKAEKMLGFKAEFPLMEGLTRYFHWLKKGEKNRCQRPLPVVERGGRSRP